MKTPLQIVQEKLDSVVVRSQTLKKEIAYMTKDKESLEHQIAKLKRTLEHLNISSSLITEIKMEIEESERSKP